MNTVVYRARRALNATTAHRFANVQKPFGSLDWLRIESRGAYTLHELYSITKFEIVGPYTLRLTFDDGAVNTIDFLPMLRGVLYSPLRDKNIFNQVRLDPETRNILWSNGADFDPATLHDWNEVGQEMIEMASSWEIISAKAL